MGRKKSEIPQDKTSPIDFINWLTCDKKSWEELSSREQKAFEIFIINKWFSMDLDWCEAINELQQYTMNMEKSVVWKLYYELLPKKKIYFKYIKAKELEDISKEDIDCFKKYFLVSERECRDYLQILGKTNEGKLEIKRINSNFI